MGGGVSVWAEATAARVRSSGSAEFTAKRRVVARRVMVGFPARDCLRGGRRGSDLEVYSTGGKRAATRDLGFRAGY